MKSRKNSSRAALSSAAAGADELAAGPAPKGATWSTWLPRLVRAHSHVPSWAPQLGHIAVPASPSWMSVFAAFPIGRMELNLDETGKVGAFGENPVPVPACAWYPARRSGFLRHTARPAEGCCRQALTRFAAPHCAGPDRRARHQAAPALVPRCGRFRLACHNAGGVRERPNRHDWKSCVGKLTVGSNPTLSARFGQVRRGAHTHTHRE